MSLPWFRAYGRDLLSDGTLLRWPVGQRWCWVGALAIANQAPERGLLIDDSGTPYTVKDIADLLHVSWKTADRFLMLAVGAGRITERDGILVVTNFNRRNAQGRGTGPAPTEGAPERGTRSHALDDAPLSTHARGPSAEAEREEEKEVQAEAVSLRGDPSLPFNQVLVHSIDHEEEQLRRFASKLRDADANTWRTLRTLRRRHALSWPDFDRALESLALRRRNDRRSPLVSEAAYVCAALKSIADERGTTSRERST